MMTLSTNGTNTPKTSRIALLGNYSPRRCGIATFTEDLAESLVEAGSEVFVIAMDDRPEGYSYPSIVGFRILEKEVQDYRLAAKYVTELDADVLCVQHEFGIFGGPAGSYVLELLQNVDIPIVTTLHTVLREPSPHQMRVMKELAGLSSRLVVMSERGREYLTDVYGIDSERIDVIHHGIHPLPSVPSTPTARRKILTFGLLGPDKGIENVISALPEIVERHDVEYLVVGATHPNLIAQHGESYRSDLVNLARELGVSNRVKFIDKFVSREELATYMAEATIYVTPYNKLQQITSGTLAYAVGNGRAVISSPYWYAEELLADGRGVLVPPRDSSAIASALDRLLSDEAERSAIASRAKAFGMQMQWPNVAKAYRKSFANARRSGRRAPTTTSFLAPKPDFRHLYAMTDDTGVLQHATYTIPNLSEGYCVDDNARALQMVCLAHGANFLELEESTKLASRYLAFVAHSYNDEVGAFRNFMSYGRKWLETAGSEDSQGRTMRALGLASRSAPNESCRALAASLFDRALLQTMQLQNLRSIAFAILGLVERLSSKDSGSATSRHIRELAQKLEGSLQDHTDAEWPWFENSLTYCNAVLPQALLEAGDHLGARSMRESALDSLSWLADVQSDQDGRFLPIGSNGFKMRGGARAHFDQQPVEAWASTSAYSSAYRITGDSKWLELARRAVNWFLGDNYIGSPIYDSETGGCRDGLHRDRLNENQGAESTLSYLMSLCEWHQITKIKIPQARSIVLSM